MTDFKKKFTDILPQCTSYETYYQFFKSFMNREVGTRKEKEHGPPEFKEVSPYLKPLYLILKLGTCGRDKTNRLANQSTLLYLGGYSPRPLLHRASPLSQSSAMCITQSRLLH